MHPARASALLLVISVAASGCGRTALDELTIWADTPGGPSGSYAGSDGRAGDAVAGFAAGPNGTRLDLHLANGASCAMNADRVSFHFFADLLPLERAAPGTLAGQTFAFEAWRGEPGRVAEYAVAATVRFDRYERGKAAAGHWTFTHADGGVEQGAFEAHEWCDWSCPLGIICG